MQEQCKNCTRISGGLINTAADGPDNDFQNTVTSDKSGVSFMIPKINYNQQCESSHKFPAQSIESRNDNV
jgi:hypothetical protein